MSTKTDNAITVGLVAVIGVILFFLYKVLSKYMPEIFKLGFDFKPSFSLVVALVISLITWIYIGKTVSGLDFGRSTTLIVASIGAFIAFLATYNYWIWGIVIGIIIYTLYTVLKILKYL